MSEISSSGFLPDAMEVVENFTDGDLKVMKGYVPGTGNCTCAEFDKEGRHFVVEIWYWDDMENINLSDDVKLIKELKESTKPKNVSVLEFDEDFFDQERINNNN